MQEGDARKTRRCRGAVQMSWATRFITRRGLQKLTARQGADQNRAVDQQIREMLTDQDILGVRLGRRIASQPSNAPTDHSPRRYPRVLVRPRRARSPSPSSRIGVVFDLTPVVDQRVIRKGLHYSG